MPCLPLSVSLELYFLVSFGIVYLTAAIVCGAIFPGSSLRLVRHTAATIAQSYYKLSRR